MQTVGFLYWASIFPAMDWTYVIEPNILSSLNLQNNDVHENNVILKSDGSFISLIQLNFTYNVNNIHFSKVNIFPSET